MRAVNRRVGPPRSAWGSLATQLNNFWPAPETLDVVSSHGQNAAQVALPAIRGFPECPYIRVWLTQEADAERDDAGGGQLYCEVDVRSDKLLNALNGPVQIILSRKAISRAPLQSLLP